MVNINCKKLSSATISFIKEPDNVYTIDNSAIEVRFLLIDCLIESTSSFKIKWLKDSVDLLDNQRYFINNEEIKRFVENF